MYVRGQSTKTTFDLNMLSFWKIFAHIPSVEEEEAFPGRSAEVPPGALDVEVLDDGPDADEEPEGHDQPPEPGVLRGGKVGRLLEDQRPLGQGQAEAGEGAVPGKEEKALL